MRKGFSLVELILGVVILAVAVYGTMIVLGGMSRQSTDAEKQTLAVEYGRMRMEQILGKRFDESAGTLATCTFTQPSSLGYDSGESGATFDDVDDLNGLDGELSTDPLYGRGLKSQVTVQYVTPGTATSGSLVVSNTVSTCFKRITVVVKDSKTNQVLTTLRGMANPYK